jgi:hypothetical protein
MKKSSLTQVVVLLLSVLMADGAAGRCVDPATKIVATYPYLFDVHQWCSKTILVDDLVTGAGRFGISSLDVKFHYADVLTNSPPDGAGPDL